MSGYRRYSGYSGYKRAYGNPYGFQGGARMLRRIFKKKTPLKKVQKDVRFLKRNIEIKQIDRVIEGHSMPSFVGSSDPLLICNYVQQGNTYTQRVGNKIALKDIHVRAKISWTLSPRNGVNYINTNAYRVLLVYDKYCSVANGGGVPTTTPAFNTIFQDRDTTGTASQSWLSGKNHDLGDRFVILHDKVRYTAPVINPLINTDSDPDTPSAVNICFLEDFTVPLKGRTTCFNTNEITEGALYLIFIAQTHNTMVSQDVDNLFGITRATARLRYYDI